MGGGFSRKGILLNLMGTWVVSGGECSEIVYLNGLLMVFWDTGF